jgi:hypothetical protein
VPLLSVVDGAVVIVNVSTELVLVTASTVVPVEEESDFWDLAAIVTDEAVVSDASVLEDSVANVPDIEVDVFDAMVDVADVSVVAVVVVVVCSENVPIVVVEKP